MKRVLAVLGVLLGLLVVTLPAHAAPVTRYPGTVWHDASGSVIQAHGGGITKVGGTYYWLGEDKTDGSPFQNIKCYSSTDFKKWTFVRNVLTRQSGGDLGPNRVVERPHVVYNSSTQQFVMYMHIDSSNYSERKAGVATSTSVCGAYSYRGSFKPLGHDSLDDNLFLDGGTAYLLSEDRTNAKLQIYRLSPDFLSVSALVKTLPQYESCGHGQGRRHLLPLRLAPDRLVDQRQPVRDRHLPHGHLVVLAQFRAVRHQDVRLADNLHPAHHRLRHDQLRLHGRPVELRQPQRLAVHLAAARHQRNHRVDRLPGLVDR